MVNYNANFPADTDFIADGPKKIRENQEALRAGQIVDAGSIKGLISGNASGQIPISNGNVNINLNAEKLQNKTPSDFAATNHTHAVATLSSNGMMSNADKTKLDNIVAGAQPNQNAFSNVLINGVTIQADSPTDILEIVAGDNIALVADAANDRIIIKVTGKVDSAKQADVAINTDTVDGKHASDFAPTGFGLGVALSSVSVADPDNATITGMYYAASNAKLPAGVQDGTLLVLAYSSAWLTQQLQDLRTNRTFTRVKSNGIWSGWNEVSYTNYKPYVISATAPSDTSKIWIDNSAIAYINNGTTWVALRGVYLD